jgi:hypothetical protein
MEFTVDVTMDAFKPLSEDALFDIAEIGGVAVGRLGGARVDATFTVKAADVTRATERAIAMIVERIPGTVVAVEAMTTDGFDRRLENQTEIAGVTEVARMLGVTKQRVSSLSKRGDFPQPLAKLAAGPVWRAGDLTTFAEGWQRKAGRPTTRVTEHVLAEARQLGNIPSRMTGLKLSNPNPTGKGTSVTLRASKSSLLGTRSSKDGSFRMRDSSAAPSRVGKGSSSTRRSSATAKK